MVVGYLLAGMAWALVGFLWIFGTHNSETCNHESSTYKVGQIETRYRFVDRQKERE